MSQDTMDRLTPSLCRRLRVCMVLAMLNLLLTLLALVLARY